MSDLKTLQKCRKFMTLFEKKESAPSNPTSKPKDTLSRQKSTLSKPKDTLSKKSIRATSKTSKPLNSSATSFKSNPRLSSSHKPSPNSKASVSNSKVAANFKDNSTCYNRQSRYEKIMKLQTKSKTKVGVSKKLNAQSYLQSSRSSLASVSSGGSKSLKPESRLEKIMRLKVNKPQIQSTLKNYEPVKREKSLSSKQNTDYNSVLELKKCKDKIRKENKQEDKEDRMWKVFERERDLRLKQKRSREEEEYRREISLEKRLDRLVQKELLRMQNEKELEDRKELGFSPYLFPY